MAMQRIWGLGLCGLVVCVPLLVLAEALPMAARASLLTQRAPLFDTQDRGASGSASLFAGNGAETLFAVHLAVPDTLHRSVPRAAPRAAGPVADLRNLIAKAEAGTAGYDAVQHGARIKTPTAPTAMTVQQIYDWIDATPGQPHAIGRYQFIPITLRRLVARLNVDPRSRFSPALQDRLADQLLVEAGLRRFLAGEMPRRSFMNNLAKIWAGLPNDTGKSHYHGYAGNKATMTWARFDREMARIFPG
ncbi:MAG: hypothetical protein AAFY39_13505 [Pseudomonadota bacterium]